MTVTCSPEPPTAAPSGGESNLTHSVVIQLPWGLIGFERIDGALLVSGPRLEPFCWLAFAADPEEAGLLVLEPRYLDAAFDLDVEASDCESLGLKGPEDARVYVVVTLQAGEVPTANLRGPIVGNRDTGVFRQIIPRNAADLPLRHPLIPAATQEAS